MWEMKGDMAGAAAVLFAMRALGRLRPDVKVVGILCCAENMPDANAQRPGDILTAKNGKSVMVDNTDAEGRLVLMDGLARAGEEGATHVIDIATLTGAVVRALGPSVAGVMGDDPGLVHRVIRSGEPRRGLVGAAARRGVQGDAQDALCRREQHRGGRPRRRHHRRALLARVRPRTVAWAHLDIAGPMFRDKEWKYDDSGAIGFGVKTLVDLCERFRDPVA